MTSNKIRSRLFASVAAYPRLILAVALFLSILSVIYTKQRMEFLTGRDDLMPKTTAFHRDYRSWLAEFGESEEIVVVLEGADQEKVGRFAAELAEALKRETRHVRDVFHPFGLPFFRQNGLLLLPLSDLENLHRNLTLAKPVLKELAAAPSVQTLFTFLTSEADRAIADGDPKRLESLLFMLDKLGEGLTRFGGKDSAPLSLEEFFFRGADGKESAMARAGRMQILTVQPVKDRTSFVPAEETIRIVRAEIAKLQKQPELRGVNVGLTGVPVLEHEEMTTSEHDIAIATVISLVLTVLLLLLAFRGILNTIAAMVSLIVAICLSFGFATLAVGHLNILSMVFAIMLIGIGIEYGIQIVLRYKEELVGGADHPDAIATGLDRNVWAIIMAAATVAAAFLTFAFTDFKGIAELGIIAAGGIVICVAVTFTVLPAMLLLLARFRKSPVATPVRKAVDSDSGYRRILFGYPRTLLAVTAVFCLISLYPASRVRFDYNLMNMQAKGLESVEYAHKLMRSKENSGYFAVVMAASSEEAAAKTRALEALPTVDHVVSVFTFVPDQQEKKLALLADLRRELADVKPGTYEEDLQVLELPAVFEGFRDAVVRLKKRLDEEKRPEAEKAGAFLATLDAFFARLEKQRNTNALGMLRDFQGGMFAELPAKIGLLKESLNASPVTLADVPAELKERFIGRTGKYLLQVAPKEEIFDREPLAAFIGDVRKVDPHATGEPVMVFESMTILRDAYRGAFIYAFVAIVGILFVTFRSIRFTVIGLVPLVVGVLLMVSGMWLMGVDFNSANIIVMPLVLGIAVDSGIYIVNRYRREDETPVQVIYSSTGIGVLLNTLTIMASFGALMVAHHRGVFSIGAAMSLGMLACQVAFVLVLPAVLTLFGKRT
ncbi:MMPL family transporter [Geobacter sp. DSM 9736]|uniref:MMPL family transporter n=1 Tax=Geobacter sp. DSM 9736 TaxID=1277350 RepID=UPI0035134A15